MLVHLTLPYTVSRRLIMQKACGTSYKDDPHFVDVWFQVLFHSPYGVLFAFPSRYWFTIGHWRVFSLGRWPSLLQTGFHVSGPTWDTRYILKKFRLRDFHPLWFDFPNDSAISSIQCCRSRNTTKHAWWFRLFRVRSPLLAESQLISFPLGT